MNIYDKAHELARALSSSDEYRDLLTAKTALDSDPEAKKAVNDFLMKRMELEYAALSGKPEDKAKSEQLQKLYELLSFNPRAFAFLNAQIKFQRTMADVYKIIGDSIAEGLNIFAKD